MNLSEDENIIPIVASLGLNKLVASDNLFGTIKRENIWDRSLSIYCITCFFYVFKVTVIIIETLTTENHRCGWLRAPPNPYPFCTRYNVGDSQAIHVFAAT